MQKGAPFLTYSQKNVFRKNVFSIDCSPFTISFSKLWTAIFEKNSRIVAENIFCRYGENLIEIALRVFDWFDSFRTSLHIA